MYTIFLKATHKMNFQKESNLTIAKEKVSEAFKMNPSYFYASIYDPETNKEIERFRCGEWAVKVDKETVDWNDGSFS